MADLFRRNNSVSLPERQIYLTKYMNARANLLLVVAFTVINVVLALFDASTYFLFSAYIPYILTLIAMDICGMYPDSYYLEYYGETFSKHYGAFAVMMAIVVIMVLVYFLCWLLSKKLKIGWIICALVLFSIDTVFLLLGGIALESLLDIAFHAWIIWYLVTGIVAYVKLKSLPEEAEAPLVVEETAVDIGENADEPSQQLDKKPDTPIMRRADNTVKARVLLEVSVYGHNVCYRRVKKVNELVIDNMVYDETEMLFEKAHALYAVIDGHEIQVGYDGNAQSYAVVDGKLVANKLRLI